MKGKCDRCKKDKLELYSLELKSKRKHSEILLCNICFGAAQALWTSFMEYAKGKRNG